MVVGRMDRMLLASDGSTVGNVCVAYEPGGWYASRDASLSAGLPPQASDGTTFSFRPPTLSACELEQLHTDCVTRINAYRDGTLKFSDGTDDSNVLNGLQPLQQATGSNECSSSQAMGDLVQNYAGTGGCDGSHHTAGTCRWASATAQNTCCGRGGGSFGSKEVLDTYEEVRDELYACLQDMVRAGTARTYRIVRFAPTRADDLAVRLSSGPHSGTRAKPRGQVTLATGRRCALLISLLSTVALHSLAAAES